MNKIVKVLYSVGLSFAFKRTKAGGFISSGKGVIDGLNEHGYFVDILTDSVLPEVTSDFLKTYFFYDLRLLRMFLPIKTILNVKGILSSLDSYYFEKSIRNTLPRLLMNNQYNFVYLRASHTGHIVAQIVKDYNIPLVLEVNRPLSMGPYNQQNGSPWPKKKSDVKVSQDERIQYDAASIITVDSPLRGKWITDFVDEKYGEKLVIIPNAVNSEIFKPLYNQLTLKRNYSFDENKILVGMASSFRWYNDLNELCEIIKLTIKINCNILFLLIIGDKRRVKPIKNLIKINNLENNTKILEQIPFHEMPKILNMCDILISHFNFHGVWPHICSIKHMEYLAVGKPVVATNVGYVNFAIEDNVNGILINEGDVQGFRNAVLKLACDKDMCKNYGHNGRKKAVDELTWYRNVNNFIQPLLNLHSN